MRQTKKQKQHLYWFILAFWSYACGMTLWVASLDEAQPTATITIKQTTIEKVVEKITPKGTLARVTGFSSVECHTTWCTANKGLPRGEKVAVNAKFGKVKKVYIPAFDKYYQVIGTTDYKTDVDIWFGDDQQSALKLGFKELTVNLIY